MELAKRRVQVAEDVIKHLKANRIAANSGSYLNLSVTPTNQASRPQVERFFQWVEENQGTDLQQILKTEPCCDVCALGAMLYAVVDKENDFAIDQSHFYSTGSITRESILARIAHLFDEEQLALIEAAFELKDINDNLHMLEVDEEEVDEAIEFGGRFDYRNERLEAIMRNIITNNGTFIPAGVTV